jgi:hypothetical protein
LVSVGEWLVYLARRQLRVATAIMRRIVRRALAVVVSMAAEEKPPRVSRTPLTAAAAAAMATVVMTVLTVTAGAVDVISFLSLGQVFTALQTGNVLFLSFSLAGMGSVPAWRPFLSLAAFTLGAALGSTMISRLGRRRWLPVVLGAEAVLLAAAGAVALRVGVGSPSVSPHPAVIALVALAMGLQSMAALRARITGMSTQLIPGLPGHPRRHRPLKKVAKRQAGQAIRHLESDAPPAFGHHRRHLRRGCARRLDDQIGVGVRVAGACRRSAGQRGGVHGDNPPSTPGHLIRPHRHRLSYDAHPAPSDSVGGACVLLPVLRSSSLRPSRTAVRSCLTGLI